MSFELVSVNKIVVFESNGHAVLGLVLSAGKQKFQILSERNSLTSLALNRLHLIPGGLKGQESSNSTNAKLLEELHKEAQNKSASVSVEEIWNVVVDDGEREYTVGELMELYFSESSQLNHLSLYLALIEESTYFKRKRDAFVPRSKKVVEELQRARIAAQARAEERDKTIEFFKKRIVDPALEPSPEMLEQVRILEDLGLGNNEHINVKEAREFLSLALEALNLEHGGSLEERCLFLLRKLQFVTKATNLVVIKHRPPISFPRALLEEAAAISNALGEVQSTTATSRKDLTHLDCFTVDDSSTLDMDDALSFRQTDDGFELGIHISDVSALIKPGSALDLEAMRRATSIYCPDQSINMFPDTIAHNFASLIANEVRPTLSYLVALDKSRRVKEVAIVPALIRVQNRYSYTEMDDMLEAAISYFIDIYNISTDLELSRINSGAYRVNKRDVSIAVSSSGKVEIADYFENSPARVMIAEMMVLANRSSAEFAYHHSLPFLYRTQAASDKINLQALDKIPDGPARDFASRTTLKPSEFSVKPNLHSTLGLDYYCQVTSPIRRYLDLCNQRQIASYLRNSEPLYTSEQLLEILHQASHGLQIGNSITRESKRFWLLRYLKDLPREDRTIQGTVVRLDLKNPMVELDQVYITVPIRNAASKELSLGTRLNLRVVKVVPETNYVKLELA